MSSDSFVPLDDAVAVFERLIIDSGKHADRAAIHRAMQEGSVAWPGELNSQWWRWVAEAGRSLGWKCRIADCRVDELVSLGRDGVRWMIYLPDTQSWLAVTEQRGRWIRVAGTDSAEPSRSMSHRQLRRLLAQSGKDQRLRCVIIQDAMTYGSLSSTEHHDVPPLSRLWKLLVLERRDATVLIIYALVAGLLTLATPVAVESLVNTVAFGRLIQPVVVLALVLFAFLAFQAAVRGMQTWVVEIIQRRLFARLTADLAYRLPSLELDSDNNEYVPELVNRFFDIVTVQKVVASLLLDGLSLVLSALVGMLVLAFYHPMLLAFDVVLILMLLLIVFVFGHGAVKTSINESKCKYLTAAWLQDLARCQHAFKYDGGLEFALERADKLTFDYLTARRLHFRILMRQVILSLGVQAIASTSLLAIGGGLVISGKLTLGQLVAAELIVTTIVSSFAKLGKHMEGFYDLLASIDKIGHLLDLRIEPQSGMLHGFGQMPATVTVSMVESHSAKGLRGLCGVDLSIASGERVALTGQSGAGKSELLGLLFGLRDPAAGHLAIDGIDPRDLRPDVLRRRVILLRGTEVFHGTVEENVHLSRLDVTTGEVRKALQAVGLLDDVLHLPSGMETIMSSSGEPFSETQLRQLVLARAIAGRPGLLLIDGLLDALPDDLMRRIADLLFRRDQPWTLILVTGRQVLADRCDRILQLDAATTTETDAQDTESSGPV
jgi:putative ABC transport system ATP-binding protein